MPSPLRSLAGAATGLVGAILVSLLALAPVSADVPAVLYVLSVATAAAVGGAFAGAVATIASFLGFTYLFTPPLHSFELDSVSDAVTFTVFVVAAAGVSWLVAHERSTRRAAEAAQHEAASAAAHSARLQAVTALLARALTREDMADLVIEHAAAALGATIGLVALLDEERETLRTIKLVGAPPDGSRARDELPLDLPTPLGDAIREGTPIWFSSLQERNERYPDLVRYEGDGAIAAIPMIVGGRRLGGLVLLARRPGGFDVEERQFALALAGLCAHAFERARLFELEHDARLAAEQARAELERTERSQREFVANAAHEIRAPLTVISGTVEILRAEADDPQLRERFLAHLERESARLTRLVVALLTLARVQSGVEVPERRRVELAPLLEAVASSVSASGDRPRPRIRCAASLALETNADLLAHALTNLAANAARYDPVGEPELRARRSDATIEIQVLDRGPGIPAAERERIFDRFARGSETSRDGFGLGLAIARDAVAAIDGSIELEARRGGGTVARVTLPAAQSAPRTRTRRPSASSSGAAPAASART